MRLRVRGPSGVSQISVSDDSSWGDLKHTISEKTSVADFDVKYGYPPQALDTESIDNGTKLTDIGIKLDGEQLTIVPRDIQHSLHSPLSGSNPDPRGVGRLPPLKDIQPRQHNPEDFPSGPSQAEARAAPLTLAKKPNNLEGEPPEIPVPALDGVLVLRVMPDDNSCMFRAVGGAVLGNALDAMNEVCSTATLLSITFSIFARMNPPSPESNCCCSKTRTLKKELAKRAERA